MTIDPSNVRELERRLERLKEETVREVENITTGGTGGPGRGGAFTPQ